MMPLDKIVTLHCRAPDILRQIVGIAHDDSYVGTMQTLELSAARKAPDASLSGDILKLFEQIKEKGLFDTFLEAPKLSEIARDDFLTLAKFADVQPDSKSMFRTEDPVFMRLSDVSKQGPVIVQKLIADDFCQLAILAFYFPNLWTHTLELSKEPEWAKIMVATELILSGQPASPEFPLAASFAKEVSDAKFSDPTFENQTPLRSILLSSPRLSAILPEGIPAYEAVRPRLPDLETLIDRQLTPNPSPVETGRFFAKSALELLADDENTKRIAHNYELRQRALKELTDRRIFVKRDVLELLSSKLYDLMQRDFAGLLQIEKQVLQPEPSTKAEELEKLRTYLDDERLVRLFKLQPYFGHLDGSPPPASSSLPPFRPDASMGGGGSPTVPDTSVIPPTGSTIFETAATGFVVGSNAKTVAAQNIYFNAPSTLDLHPTQYDDVHVSLEREPTGESYRVTMKFAADGDEVSESGVKPDWDKLRRHVERLQHSHQDREAFRAATPDFMDQLQRLGSMVHDTIFAGRLERKLKEVLESPSNVRLNWLGDPEDPRSAMFPWESLYVPSMPLGFLALSRKYSLTRRHPKAKSIQVFPAGRVVRVLFVTASPSMVAPLPGIEQERASLDRVLGHSGRAHLETIEEAKIEEVHTKLREFRPDIFHFSGHGRYDPSATSGALIFQKPDATPDLVSAEKLATMLYENEVSLVLLNGCDTGVSSTNDALSSAAGALVNVGVPAVVATMREVMDEAAARFSREFYRSFVGGYTIEACMGEARKALSLDNWDWSSYALFVGSTDPSRFRMASSARAPE